MRRRDREITDIMELENIIESSDVCRISFANDNFPYIVTMNFGYSGGENKKLYFHCSKEGKKLDMMKKNNYVCFSLDTDHNLNVGKNACDYGMSYRSVVGWGRITIITDEDEKRVGIDSIMLHYSNEKYFSYEQAYLERMLLLRLDILEMTGKKCN